MGKELPITPGKTTFTAIRELFADGKKDTYALRYDGHVLYSHAKYKGHGSGAQEAALRDQKKSDGATQIRDALSTEFGPEFARKVMVKLHVGPAKMDLHQAVTRGDLNTIQAAVDNAQKELLADVEDTWKLTDGDKIATAIGDFYQDQQKLTTQLQKIINLGKCRGLMSGDFTPEQLQASLLKKVTNRWLNAALNAPNAPVLSKAQFIEKTEEVTELAASVFKQTLPKMYDAIGIKPAGNRYIMTEAGLNRFEQERGDRFQGLKAADLQYIANLWNNRAGLKQHLDNHPELVLALLAPTSLELESQFKHLPNLPAGFDFNGMIATLITATGIYPDATGLVANSQQLANLFQGIQGQPGVAGDFAYRVEVELQKLASANRLGGPALLAAANAVYKKDVARTQKPPAELECLTRNDMQRLDSVLNNPVALKALVSSDDNLLIKIATTYPDEMKNHLALLKLSGLNLDAAYTNLLAALPGHDRTFNTNGKLQSVSVGTVTYKVDQENFGDQASFGDIFLMSNQSDPTDKIVLKKLKTTGLQKAEIERAWGMMSNEIKIHAWLSESYDNVVQFRKPIRIGNDLYMAMECCPGGSLNSLCIDRKLDRVANTFHLAPRIQMALKLSILEDMLECLGTVSTGPKKIVHHDVKPGNYFMRADGRVVLADFGTASVGTTSNNYCVVDNDEVKSPESMAAKKQGPPYSAVGIASDLFSLGMFANNLLLGRDNYAFTIHNSNKIDMLEGLHAHRGGLSIPPAPQPFAINFDAAKAAHEKALNQQKLIQQAGFQINNGVISLYAENTTNPLERLVNVLTVADENRRATATAALLATQPFQVLVDPDIKTNLQKLSALMNEVPLIKDLKGNVTGVRFTDAQQQTDYDDLVTALNPILGNDNAALWNSMGL